jgi:hypothetical protein
MKIVERLGMAAVLVAFGLSAGSVASAEGRGIACGCGPKVVAERGSLVVLPTAHDDTPDDTLNLQCAIDRAGRLGIRKVRLVEGTYYTSQIVAKNFVGHLSGAGAENTVVRNLVTPLYVTPENFYFEAPSADNPWPSLLAFVDGRFRVSDLTIRVVGAPAVGWSIFGLPPLQALAHGITILGTRAEATIENVAVEGEELSSDPIYGLNVYNGIFFEGFIGADPAPIAGSLTVRHCAFRRVGSGAPIAQVRGADISILDNRFEDVLWGAEVIDVQGTRYRFLGNHVSAWAVGLDQYDMCMSSSLGCGVANSTLTVAGNHFERAGVRLEGTLGSRVRCAVIANDYAADVSPDVYLGPGTHDCLVVGTTDVVDEGTNNHVVP